MGPDLTKNSTEEGEVTSTQLWIFHKKNILFSNVIKYQARDRVINK